MKRPTEEAEAAKAALAVAKHRLWQQWRRENYDPRRHLRAVTADGDPEVMHKFFDADRRGTEDKEKFVVGFDGKVRATRAIICRLSCLDMLDIAEAVRAARRAASYVKSRTE